jgi:ribonuclease-3
VAETLDLVQRGPLGAGGEDRLMDAHARKWLEEMLGRPPRDLALFQRALTHSSHTDDHYERLEFLGDRVLGLVMATWLYQLFPDEPEGKLSRRFNALVAGETCAEIAREMGIPRHVRLGKQAREDGASESDNVLGDVVESLIGALYLEAGFEAAGVFIQGLWGERVSTRDRAPKHPKSALQEWAAANERKPPAYRLADRSGPHHAPRFVVEVEVAGIGSASAEGTSKQEAETAAAAKLMEQLK